MSSDELQIDGIPHRHVGRLGDLRIIADKATAKPFTLPDRHGVERLPTVAQIDELHRAGRLILVPPPVRRRRFG